MKLSTICEARYSLYASLMRLRPEIIKVVQSIYDEWEQEEFDSGGICDEISSAIGGVLTSNGIECTEGGHDGDDHSYLIAYDDNESYVVDIPYHIYEQGGGYNWTKVQGVNFDIDNIEISPTDRPDWIDEESV
jgi:hypothetical protein